MKTRIFLIICLITGIAVHLSANEKIYINREVTTHIVMPENIKWWIFPLLRLLATSVQTILSVSSLIWK